MLKNKKETKKVSSKEFFANIKQKAEINLFNLDHSGLSNIDPNIVKLALKNLIFYTEKKLSKLDKPEENINA